MRQFVNESWNGKLFAGRWAAGALALGLLGLMLLVGAPVREVVGEETAVAPSPLAGLEHLEALSCDDVPFSRVIEVGGDYEMFVSFADAQSGSSSQDKVAGLLFDATTSGQIVYDQTFFGEGPTTLLSPPVVTAVDFNGNGHTDFVQIYTDANNQIKGVAYQQLPDGSTVISEWQDLSLNYRRHAITSGDFNRSNTLKKEVAFVSASQTTGALQVSLLLGNGASGFFPGGVSEPFGRWRTIEDNRSFPAFIDIASGDLNGNGMDDQIVVGIMESTGNFAQIIVLEYDPDYQSGSGSNYKNRLREIASARIEINQVTQFKVAVGDFDGDYHSEIALVTADYVIATPGQGNPIRARFFDYDLTNPDQPQIIQRAEWLRDHRAVNLVATAADTDADGRDELVIAYFGRDGLGNNQGLYLTTLNAEFDTIAVHNHWYDNGGFRDEANFLSLAVANLTRIDAYKEIVLAFRDSGGRLQVAALADNLIPNQGMTLLSAMRDHDNSLRTINRNISLALGDWDNDSFKAHYEAAPGADLLCKRVIEPQITAAVFVPPFWQNMQGTMSREGSIGQSQFQSQTIETSLTNFRSHSVSGYYGIGAGGEVLGIGAETSIRLTAGYDYNTSSSQGSAYSQGQTTHEANANTNNFLLYESSAYDCFHYQLKQTDEPLDASLRFCEYLSLASQGPNLESWDRDNSPLTRADAYQWTPVTRDWADLTLFRGAYAAQSSTDFGGVASRAVDKQLDTAGNFDGAYANQSVTHTAYENQPWWQVDLGAVQPLEKVRLWNRTDANCGSIHCSERLANFYLFVSEVDFRQISNDPDVLRQDPRVRTYTLSDIHAELTMDSAAGRVTTFQTMRQNGSQWLPVNGRYVRVQLAGEGILSLAEVQVFGPNHVEPDRYPVQVADSTPGDNRFEVRLYNPTTGQYQWVTVRGNLQWNGSNQQVLQNKVVGPGESIVRWSVYNDSVNSSISATSSTHAMRVGTEFDFKAGVVVNTQFGASYEWTAGLTRDEVRSYSWGQGFEMGGSVTGFPNSYSGLPWVNACKYRFQPFVYEIVEESSFGYTHRFPILDYIVPTGDGEAFLIRGSQALESCRQGQFVPPNQAPQANDVAYSVVGGMSLTVGAPGVLANDVDGDGDPLAALLVSNVAHGALLLNLDGSFHYTPQPGFVGTDAFTYRANDGLADSNEAVVTITVLDPADLHFVWLPLVTRP